MKRMTAFFIVMLIGWNLVLSIQLYQTNQDASASLNGNSNGETQSNVRQEKVEVTSDVSELVTKSEQKVVTIGAYVRGQEAGTGSGAVYKVESKTVYIITNNHVVADGDEIHVIFANNEEYTAEVVGKDQLTDLALLKVDVDFDAETFTMGDSSLVNKGEYVIAMGSPLGLEYQGSVSGGLISGVDRRMEMDIDNNGVSDWDLNVLQTDAAINPGNSGGPLINMAGELIGINSMKISDTSVEGFGFALPINEVLPIISQLEKDGQVVRPILGISVQPISTLSSLERAYLEIDHDVKNGLLIIKVSKESPAYTAGIETGDVLLKLDGKELEDFKQFRQVLYSKNVGDEVELVWLHDGKEEVKSVTLK